MTPHDKTRWRRAQDTHARPLHNLETMPLEKLREAKGELHDALAGLQSTDEPSWAEVAPVHDDLLRRHAQVVAELKRRGVPT